MEGSSDDHRQVLGTFREVFLERLVQGRDCGECIACCKILTIDKPELQKPGGVLCPHNTGNGCGIYETRPGVCQTWYCLWRRIDALPDFCRPDKIGVVISVDQHEPARTPFERLYIVVRAINSLVDFETPQARAAIEMFIDEGSLPVWLSFNGNKQMIYPRREVAEAVLGLDTSPSLAEEVATWKRRLQID